MSRRSMWVWIVLAVIAIAIRASANPSMPVNNDPVHNIMTGSSEADSELVIPPIAELRLLFLHFRLWPGFGILDIYIWSEFTERWIIYNPDENCLRYRVFRTVLKPEYEVSQFGVCY